MALWAAAVLDRLTGKAVAQDVEKGTAVVLELDIDPVQPDGERLETRVLTPVGGWVQLKEDPQPQVRVAFGFVMWNPASFSPSL